MIIEQGRLYITGTLCGREVTMTYHREMALTSPILGVASIPSISHRFAVVPSLALGLYKRRRLASSPSSFLPSK